MRNSWSRFVQPFGFSNGWAEVGVEWATAVGAEFLDRLLAGEGSARNLLDHLRRRVDGGDGARAVQVLDHALTHEEHSSNERDRREDAGAACATRSTQKLPRVRRPLRVIPRIEGDRHREPDGGERILLNPSIWLKWLATCSPENHCQFVLVTKEAAALNAPTARCCHGRSG